MIEGIDIDNFGSFKGFRWDNVRDRSGNRVSFRTLNLLYGRNYSGKTTLSQIVRALETGMVPPNYDGANFSVYTDAGAVTHAQIDGTKRNVRVFNRAFIDQHLSFLRRPDGTIESFAVFGEENKDAADRIKEITLKLGSIEGKAGLLNEHADAIGIHQQAQQAVATAEQALENQLVKKATSPPDGIKHHSDIFGDVNYNKTKLREDIGIAKNTENVLLDDAEAGRLKTLVRESARPVYQGKVEFESDFPAIATSATELISRRITPTQPLQELLNEAMLQSWVEVGMRIHRDQRATCGFCQQPLPPDLWAKLDAHFNQAAKALSLEIRICQESIQQELQALDNLHRVPAGAVYAVHRDELSRLNEEINAAVLNHRATLQLLAEALRVRAGNIFDPASAPATPNHGNIIRTNAEQINALVAASNDTTAQLEQLKTTSKRRLLLSEVARFSRDIQFDHALANIGTLSLRADQLLQIERTLGQRVQELQSEIQGLRDRQRDERLAARRVNEYLHKYFGHQALQLEAVQTDASAPFRFSIMRGSGGVAFNLSEGECSLVAFCYFMAKLEEPDTQDKCPVIWIDDPISSLDANHIFFVFSLIEAKLARRRQDAAGADVSPCEQLFISTHNLEFLKFLGKLSRQGKMSEHLRYFLVAQRAQGSVIELMPDHLRRFTTEFNFLFGEIYTCTNAANDATYHHCFYNFGNNLRRFLEAYLFFKYPVAGDSGDADFEHRMALFFGGSHADDALVARMAHEGSHLGNSMDKAMLPTDRDEIVRVARFVLGKLKSADKEQYACLLKSVGKSCPL